MELIRILKLDTYRTKLTYFKLIAGSQNRRKIANKVKKSINGNIQNLKILHWNKGRGKTLETQMQKLKEYVAIEKPAIISIN